MSDDFKIDVSKQAYIDIDDQREDYCPDACHMRVVIDYPRDGPPQLNIMGNQGDYILSAVCDPEVVAAWADMFEEAAKELREGISDYWKLKDLED